MIEARTPNEMKRETRKKKSRVSWIRDVNEKPQNNWQISEHQIQNLSSHENIWNIRAANREKKGEDSPRKSSHFNPSHSERLSKYVNLEEERKLLSGENFMLSIDDPKHPPRRRFSSYGQAAKFAVPIGSPIQQIPKVTRHRLTTDGSSWIDIFDLPESLSLSKEEFSALWDMHPQNKAQFKSKGEEYETSRYVRAFGKAFFFAGLDHEAAPIPPLLQRFLDYANNTKYIQDFEGYLFNMFLVNWYTDGSFYIPYHSDYGSSFVENSKGESVVFSISFGGTRVFSLVPKSDVSETDVRARSVTIPLRNRTVAVMGGLCQQTHLHSILRIRGEEGKKIQPRINLTLRIFH
jgi:alkylated DNA repair dioxygenase AlkB